jgi:hypothetical protein
MALPPRITADDGLDRIETVNQDTPLSEYPAWAREPFGGFENDVRAVERYWKAFAARHPRRAGTGNPLSRASYARQITWGLDLLRTNLQSDPTREGIITLALKVGSWITDAQWRFNRGPSTRVGIKRRKQSSKAGRKSGAVRRAKTDGPVALTANRIRRTHPYSREHSTRWLALKVATELKRKVETIRKALHALGLK